MQHIRPRRKQTGQNKLSTSTLLNKLSTWWQKERSLPRLLLSERFTQIELHEYMLGAILSDSWDLKVSPSIRRAPALVIIFTSLAMLMIPFWLLPLWTIIFVTVVLLLMSMVRFHKLYRTATHLIIQYTLVAMMGMVYWASWDIFYNNVGTSDFFARVILRTIIFIIMINVFLCAWIHDFVFEIDKLLHGYFSLWLSSGQQLNRTTVVKKVIAWMFLLAPQSIKGSVKNGLDKAYILELKAIAESTHGRPDWINSSIALIGLLIATQANKFIAFVDFSYFQNIIKEAYITTDIYQLSFSLFLFAAIITFFKAIALLVDFYPADVAYRIIKMSYAQALIYLDRDYTIEQITRECGYKHDIVTDLKAKAPEGFTIKSIAPQLPHTGTKKWRRLLYQIDQEVKNRLY
jgi:hypothetical protein